MKDVLLFGCSSKKFKIAEGQWYRYAPSYVSPAYHLLEGFPFIQEPPSGDLQERVLIRHHDYVFFFSSRRRHTRFDCDWSSDVCSSDLAPQPPVCPPSSALRWHAPPAADDPESPRAVKQLVSPCDFLPGTAPIFFCQPAMPEIGRASCRERV